MIQTMLSIPKYRFEGKKDKKFRKENKAAIEMIPIYNEHHGDFIRTDMPSFQKIEEMAYYTNEKVDIAALSIGGTIGVDAAAIANGFSAQTQKYIMAINQRQGEFNYQTNIFLQHKMETYDNPTATILRNKSNWMDVKQLVVRDELMKLQIGNSTELPLTSEQIEILKAQINGKDLSNFNDLELRKIIENVLKPDDKAIMQAFQTFKKDGTIDSGFQMGKLDELSKALEQIDLDKISNKEFRRLVENYWEKIEIHHRTSISSDPTIQSDINNLDTLNTTQHDAKHTHINEHGEKKIKYATPLKEKLRNREEELKILNRKRTVKKQISGLGAAVLIGAGTGFAIGFMVGLAQSGISPNSIKYALASGTKEGVEGMFLSGMSYSVSEMAGNLIGGSISHIIAERLGMTIAERTMQMITDMCTMGIGGSLAIIVTSVYQFTKMKYMGFSTRESMIRTEKSAIISFGVLLASVIAKGIWGGVAGLTVSATVGVIITGSSIYMVIHDKEIRKRIYNYMIELSEPREFMNECVCN